MEQDFENFQKKKKRKNPTNEQSINTSISFDI